MKEMVCVKAVYNQSKSISEPILKSESENQKADVKVTRRL